MRESEFKTFLMTKKWFANKPYAESTADERVRCCKVIEKTFKKDLDEVSKNIVERDLLSVAVKKMNKSNINTFGHALSAYFVFAKNQSKVCSTQVNYTY
jgi:hypothetical protein